MGVGIKSIPTSLIYEMDYGKPVFYKDYQEYLNGNKKLEDIMGCSYLQSILVSNLIRLLDRKFGSRYVILTNEIGLQFAKNAWRSADLVVYRKEQLAGRNINNKYLDIPPQLVVEIDTKADLDSINDTFSYYHKKTSQLLDFGVEKIVWIFTDLKTCLLAEQNKSWQIINWDTPVLLLEDMEIHIEEICSLM